mmetsp:Transcript_16396/g.32634  ORF Transcript_16396/g.32634 Transcript_16396/m.32634 type:complete len:346 (-) Transcript_16396:48-1085(-)
MYFVITLGQPSTWFGLGLIDLLLLLLLARDDASASSREELLLLCQLLVRITGARPRKSALVKPEVDVEENRVVRDDDLLVEGLGPLPFLLLALAAEALLDRVHAAPHEMVPDLEEESGMVRLAQNSLRVMQVMVIRCIEDGVVGREVRRLVAPVEVDAVEVEEGSVRKEHHVHVDGEKKREEEQRHGTEELVHVLIRDDSERGRVEKDVVVLVKGPEPGVDVPEPVVPPLTEVRDDGDDGELQEHAKGSPVISVGERVVGAVSLRPAGLREVDGDRGAQSRGVDALGRLDNLIANLLGSRVFRVGLSLPLLESHVRRPVVVVENYGGGAHNDREANDRKQEPCLQ